MSKILQLLSAVIGISLAGLGGVMAMTNPGQGDYEHYATNQLTGYLKGSVCTQVSGDLEELLRNGCKTLVDTGRPQLRNIIAQTTRRQNYLLFSIYETELSFKSPIPSYQFQTFGAFHKFHTYLADEF